MIVSPAIRVEVGLRCLESITLLSSEVVRIVTMALWLSVRILVIYEPVKIVMTATLQLAGLTQDLITAISLVHAFPAIMEARQLVSSLGIFFQPQPAKIATGQRDGFLSLEWTIMPQLAPAAVAIMAYLLRARILVTW